VVPITLLAACGGIGSHSARLDACSGATCAPLDAVVEDGSVAREVCLVIATPTKVRVLRQPVTGQLPGPAARFRRQ
jgi:hypothetical protein